MNPLEILRALNDVTRDAAKYGATEAQIMGALQDAYEDGPAVIRAARAANEEREGTA